MSDVVAPSDPCGGLKGAAAGQKNERHRGEDVLARLIVDAYISPAFRAAWLERSGTRRVSENCGSAHPDSHACNGCSSFRTTLEELPGELAEKTEERAAVMEFDGGLSRSAAEALAIEESIFG